MQEVGSVWRQAERSWKISTNTSAYNTLEQVRTEAPQITFLRSLQGFLAPKLSTLWPTATVVAKIILGVFAGKSLRLMTHVAVILAVSSVVIASSLGGQSSSVGHLAPEGSLGGVIDEAASAYIAADIALQVDLVPIEQIALITESKETASTLVSTDDTFVSKQSVVDATTKSRSDIVVYTVADGENLHALSAKFGITTDTIRWANNIDSWSDVTAGQQLTILPVNGIIHEVRDGDTPEKLASTYNANVQQIVSFNDAEATGLKLGDRVVIPEGTKPAPVYAPSRSTGLAAYVRTGFMGGHFVESWRSSPYIDNSYSFGYCTYYAAAMAGVPRNWGDARQWADSARASGFFVSSTPKIGAVAQTRSMHYLGHVAYVIDVSADGTQIKIRDMNGIAGWGNVGESDWIPAGTYENYIYTN